MSGSFYSAQNILSHLILKDNPEFADRYSFVHLSASDRMRALKGGDEYVPRADIQISVQFPGVVDGEIRSTMARIISDDALHFVAMNSSEFDTDFATSAPYGYHLRAISVPAQRDGGIDYRVPMLSMGVVVAARDPDTITGDFELRQAARNRNANFIAQFRDNPELFDFDANGLDNYPVLSRPDNYQRDARLSPRYHRRSIFGGGPVLDFA
jgi:hypothetical protein